ncbi:MAG: DUF366 family protein [Methanobacteriaceae archaeon]|jgi:hypothetical protein|nr:DUF366 family protein [Candidatus Methanorudis spinitermitis]
MTITYKHIDESFEYDGSQIEPSWAFKSFKIKGSSIITWRGPMNIKKSNLKDFEDIDLEIKSDDMVHFMVEHFDCQPANLKIAYLRQRLLVMILKEELAKNGIVSLRKGDDIFINLKKLTVSIATVSISSMKIHLAMNLRNEGTPDDVNTIGLFESFNEENNYNNPNENYRSSNNNYSNYNSINENNILKFTKNVVNSYINELKSIELDISKTNVF